jgi:hypothetical protein
MSSSSTSQGAKPKGKVPAKRFVIQSGIEYKIPGSDGKTKKFWSRIGTAFLNTSDDGSESIKLSFEFGLPAPGAEIVCFVPRPREAKPAGNAPSEGHPRHEPPFEDDEIPF